MLKWTKDIASHGDWLVALREMLSRKVCVLHSFTFKTDFKISYEEGKTVQEVLISFIRTANSVDGLEFEDWRRCVEKCIGGRLGGMTIDDLPDIYDLWIDYNAGHTANAAADSFVECQLEDMGMEVE